MLSQNLLHSHPFFSFFFSLMLTAIPSWLSVARISTTPSISFSHFTKICCFIPLTTSKSQKRVTLDREVKDYWGQASLAEDGWVRALESWELATFWASLRVLQVSLQKGIAYHSFVHWLSFEWWSCFFIASFIFHRKKKKFQPFLQCKKVDEKILYNKILRSIVKRREHWKHEANERMKKSPFSRPKVKQCDCQEQSLPQTLAFNDWQNGKEERGTVVGFEVRDPIWRPYTCRQSSRSSIPNRGNVAEQVKSTGEQAARDRILFLYLLAVWTEACFLIFLCFCFSFIKSYIIKM